MSERFNEDDILDMFTKMQESTRRRGYTADLSRDDDAESFFTEDEIYKIENPQEAIDDETYSKINTLTGVVEETAVFKRYRTSKQRKLTKTEMDDIKEKCKYVIVHDFSEKDMYHISDEDRSKNDELVEISMKLAGVKTAYRKVDAFIEAMRIVYKAWDIVADQHSLIHTREEIFDALSEGKVFHSRIPSPKLKGIRKYNLELIAKYIENPNLNPKDLLPAKDTSDEIFYMDDEREEERERILSQEEKDFIENYSSDESEGLKIKKLESKYTPTNNHGKNKKNFKKLSKSDKKIYKSYDDVVKKITSRMDSRYSFYNPYNMFDNEAAPEDNVYESFRYRGSWADKNSMKLYDIIMEQEILDTKAPNEKYQTNRDIMLTEFFRSLESRGISVKQLREAIDYNGSNEREKRMNRKKNKEIEQTIINRIIALNNNPKFKKLVKKTENKLEKRQYE